MSLLFSQKNFLGIVGMGTKEKTQKYIFKEFLGWLEAILLAVLISLLIRAFVFETVYVDGSSMEHTLSNGDRLILYKLGYFFSPPKRGDIVVLQVNEGTFRYFPFINKLPIVKRALHGIDETDYIKRVIGIPGDEVDIKDGYVYINNEKLEEPYVYGEATYEGNIELPVKVEEGTVFVLGDNRLNSRDSRELGLIEYDKIKGKAIYRVWPLDRFGSIYKNNQK